MRAVTRDEVRARPALAQAHEAYCNLFAAMPSLVGSVAEVWLHERGYETPAQCSDLELREFVAEVQGAVDRALKARSAHAKAAAEAKAEGYSPDPLTVTEILEAKQRAAKRQHWEDEAAAERRERLEECLLAGVRAARVRCVELGGRLEDLPALVWAQPFVGDPFAGVRR